MTAPSKSLFDDLSVLSWLPPWAALEPGDASEYERNLAKVVSGQHPLYGRSARAVAARTDDADDVLFLVAGPDELCVVNFGSAGSSGEPSATRPFVMSFGSVSEFEQGCMMPDHLEHTDEDV